MKRIGRYNLLKTEAVTPFSKIYKCHDPALGEDVSVKVFDVAPEECAPKKRYSADDWLERFIRGTKVLASFDHPHIIAVKEISALDDGTPYFVMPYMGANMVHEIGEDVSLEDAKKKKLPKRLYPKSVDVARTVSILRQLLEALDALHQRSIVHRDVKPGNILMERVGGETMKLCDFGMVKTPESKHSRSGVWIGTYDYLSPEQRKSAKNVDSRADIYSVGVLAYRMLTGVMPMGAFAPPHEIKPGIPVEIGELVMAAMAPEKENRPKDAKEMLARLSRIKAVAPMAKQSNARQRTDQSVKALRLYRRIFPEMRESGALTWGGVRIFFLAFKCILLFRKTPFPANIPQGPELDLAQAYYILGNVLLIKYSEPEIAAICYQKTVDLTPGHTQAKSKLKSIRPK